VLGVAGAASGGVPVPAITDGFPADAAAWGPRTAPTALFWLPSRGIAFTSGVGHAALRFLGRPYQWSGIGQRGFDCSGLVFRVFGTLGTAVPHSSFGQYAGGTSVPAEQLGTGDLVFFRTYSSGPSHVGIYLGARRFIHASVSRGVIVSSMDDPYYRSRYLGARRY
jgi:cell wall-associated NlpC family hydrolase